MNRDGVYAIETRGVYLRAGDRELLKGVSVSIPRGVIFTVIGPSGAGKSTFVRTLNRLIEPDEGEIILNGETIRSMEPTELRRRVGMVFQVPVMFDGTVRENLEYGPNLAGEDLLDPVALLDKVGLDPDFLDREAKNLSVGEQQRVCIARAIANGPEVLLMDEPTSALDPVASKRIEDLILRLKEDLGLTIVVISHDMEQSKRIGDMTMMMRDGEVEEVLPTKEFFSQNGGMM